MTNIKTIVFLFALCVVVCAPLWGLAHLTFACENAFCRGMISDHGYVFAFLFTTLASAFLIVCAGSWCACCVCVMLQIAEMLDRRKLKK